MRSLFRRKRDDPDDSEKPGTSFPGLGIFSPLSKSPQPSPTHELRRLSEIEEIFLRSKKVQSLSDVPQIVDEVRQGNIVLLDISRLNDGKDHSHLELRRIIERIRGETRGYQAEIALVNDDCMIVTPYFVRI